MCLMCLVSSEKNSLLLHYCELMKLWPERTHHSSMEFHCVFKETAWLVTLIPVSRYCIIETVLKTSEWSATRGVLAFLSAERVMSASHLCQSYFQVKHIS